MPELRKNPLTGEWVVLAPARAKRPNELSGKTGRETTCPFCPGNESQTAPEVLSYRKPGDPPESWQVRVVPNKYPAFTGAGKPGTGDAFSRRKPASGGHEVIIHSPDHDADIADLTSHQVAEILRAYRERYLAYKSRDDISYVELVINRGREAGASLEHPHSQLLALPMIPPRLAVELAKAGSYFQETGDCIFCKMISRELGGERLIEESDEFVTFVPFAAKMPFEVLIAPRRHNPFFESLTDKARADLAVVLRNALRRFALGLDSPPYNMYLHTAPTSSGNSDGYHWHLVLIPKMTTIAGFELATGTFLNTGHPEKNAGFLRSVRLTGT